MICLSAKARGEINLYAIRPPIKFGVLHIVHPRLRRILCGACSAKGKDWPLVRAVQVPDHKICRACRRIRDARR